MICLPFLGALVDLVTFTILGWEWIKIVKWFIYFLPIFSEPFIKLLKMIKITDRLKNQFKIMFVKFNFHDYQMLVQRVWFALESLPSANILSQTLTKTWNFCSRVNVSAPSHFFITWSICALEVIIGSSKRIQEKWAVPLLLQMQSVQEQVQLGRRLLRMQELLILQQVNTLLLF